MQIPATATATRAPPRDWETGEINDNARLLDTVHSRWNQQDPLGFNAGDSNLYRYVGNDPTNYKDPMGTRRILTGYQLPKSKRVELYQQEDGYVSNWNWWLGPISMAIARLNRADADKSIRYLGYVDPTKGWHLVCRKPRGVLALRHWDRPYRI
jgi:RHS repeat-associated protein